MVGRSDLRLLVPEEQTKFSTFLTASGSFKDGDMSLNRQGLRIGTKGATPAAQAGQIMLEDLETVQVVGKGSSGVVQLVRHKWTNAVFALKVIQMNIEETVRKQILQELRINQAAQCAHVVVYYDAFYNNGVISILLEYMNEGSLSDLVKRVGRIPEPFLAGISKQVLQGLDFLHHNRHIIHRDIKPSNLLVNQFGEVKISDFGISAPVLNSMEQRNTFVGTCTYMSPERLSVKQYGFASDIWSFGVTLLECALGRFPYQHPRNEDGWSNFYELLETIVDQPPPLPSPNEFSPEFCSFIGACLQKEPEDRMSLAGLLNHKFLSKYVDEDICLAVLIPEHEEMVIE